MVSPSASASVEPLAAPRPRRHRRRPCRSPRRRRPGSGRPARGSLPPGVVPGMGGHVDGDAAGQGHVAVACQQRLGGQMDGDQRGGAGGLHRDRRARQAQLVRDPGGEEVQPGGEPDLELGHALPAGRRWAHERAGVARLAAPGVDADRPRVPGGIIAGVLQRVPRALEEDAVLRIEQQRLAGRVAEEARRRTGPRSRPCRRRPGTHGSPGSPAGRRTPPRRPGSPRTPRGWPRPGTGRPSRRRRATGCRS